MSTILLLLCSAFVAFTIYSYAADQDKILLNCGSSHTILSQDGREFVGDHAYKFAPSTSTGAAASGPFLSSETLYMTARLFTEKSTYTVPIAATTRKHFLRLHFYISSYNTHNLSDAVFSVSCGPYVLLHNFPAATLKQSYVVMEFCIPINKRKQLDIIFTPEANSHKSYAFINAMEIISIPNLLFVKPVILPGSNFQPTPLSIGLHTALQNMYRLNVGGQTISPSNDKYGRTWVEDSRYLIGTIMGNKGKNSTEIQQADLFVPNYLYATYRIMHPNSLINNLNSNITWVFSNIDANFSYLVRFHFCELQFAAANQRIFDIYINNQTVEQAFDVTEVASGSNHPIYRDYVIYVPAGESASADLWVALCPNSRRAPQYYNGILNGLEIYKLNDSSGNLAGLNPVVTEEVVENSANGPISITSSSKHKGYIRGTVQGSFAGAITPCLMVLCCALKRKSKNSKGSHDKPFTAVAGHGGRTTTTSTSAENTESNASTGSHSYVPTSIASIFCRYFSLVIYD